MCAGESKIKARPFNWPDLLILYRYRHQIACLDNDLALTRGSPLGFWVVLRHLRLEQNHFTAVLQPRDGSPALIGQVSAHGSDGVARLTFLMPTAAAEMPSLPALMDELVRRAAAHGALALVATVDEDSALFEGLRRCGFAIYGWQRIWRLAAPLPSLADLGAWLPVTALDEFAIRSLYQALTPPLVQRAEPFEGRSLTGMVYQQGGEILAYMEAVFGPRGISLYPLFHPDVRDPARVLHAYLNTLHFSLGRPVYLTVRSYQSWLEGALQSLQAEMVRQQVLLVRHMAAAQRLNLNAAHNAVREGSQPAMVGPIPGGEPGLRIASATLGFNPTLTGQGVSADAHKPCSRYN